ncbi:hypothetical protein STPH1_1841 [Streptomyces sp. OM5714]|nr:hypothetical protein STPH1_1841 [Streptomyces sp. OM5714]
MVSPRSRSVDNRRHIAPRIRRQVRLFVLDQVVGALRPFLLAFVTTAPTSTGPPDKPRTTTGHAVPFGAGSRPQSCGYTCDARLRHGSAPGRLRPGFGPDDRAAWKLRTTSPCYTWSTRWPTAHYTPGPAGTSDRTTRRSRCHRGVGTRCTSAHPAPHGGRIRSA